MKSLVLVPLAVWLSACSSLPLPEPAPTGAADPAAPAASTLYQPVMSGTANHGPVGLKPWRQLNDDVAPAGAGRSP